MPAALPLEVAILNQRARHHVSARVPPIQLNERGAK
jgi:hypothetical protein